MAVDQIEHRQSIDEATYRRLALDQLAGAWELHDGRLREKPAMSVEHGGSLAKLGTLLQQQLGWDAYRVRFGTSRLRVSASRTYIPDIAVVPLALDLALRARPRTLELYEAPLPLVAEVWSPSTGDYDVEAKLDNYQRRGDEEIWYLHPYDQTLTAWVRQPDGAYHRHLHREGIVQPARLAGVEIDLAWLFAP